ncbi:response regulator [Labrys sp. LIt4]|uniref:Response regulator n=1 Tax=Labrys okinawensis TaxID=346911 RepID=A0A2S9QIV7_9HYPH|nr:MULTISPECIES: response regulator [Labrys]MBP0581230.1 response regulator [Labrys sp. LIt4]PRH89289.1 response regulator [Labrys okinawensis]
MTTTETVPGGILEGHTILVADDEIIIALDIEDTLMSAGARIAGPCLTLASALEVTEQQAITAAVLDISLGNDTSEPVVDLLAARGIPIAFCTGKMLPDTLRQKVPDAPVLSKPVQHQALLETIARLTRE